MYPNKVREKTNEIFYILAWCMQRAGFHSDDIIPANCEAIGLNMLRLGDIPINNILLAKSGMIYNVDDIINYLQENNVLADVMATPIRAFDLVKDIDIVTSILKLKKVQDVIQVLFEKHEKNKKIYSVPDHVLEFMQQFAKDCRKNSTHVLDDGTYGKFMLDDANTVIVKFVDFIAEGDNKKHIAEMDKHRFNLGYPIGTANISEIMNRKEEFCIGWLGEGLNNYMKEYLASQGEKMNPMRVYKDIIANNPTVEKKELLIVRHSDRHILQSNQTLFWPKSPNANTTPKAAYDSDKITLRKS